MEVSKLMCRDVCRGGCNEVGLSIYMGLLTVDESTWACVEVDLS